MAVDPSLKLEIRAVYESNNLSVAKVLDMFPGCEVSAKTVESWIKKENWQKKKYLAFKNYLPFIEIVMAIYFGQFVVRALRNEAYLSSVMPFLFFSGFLYVAVLSLFQHRHFQFLLLVDHFHPSQLLV